MKLFLTIPCLVLTVAILAAAESLQAQQNPNEVTVTGVVTDENKAKMAGVRVIDKTKPTVGTVTDQEGRYALKVDPQSVLEFSFIGYENALWNVAGKKTIDVEMKPNEVTLQDVVVVGYGTTTKSDMTGSVANVDLRNVSGAPVISIEQSLQGRIAGADILSTSGEPGSGSSILIRGSRSISASNEPLIVVDGVIDAVASLTEINPADIASISVLKDASSTAIYGSRGANGVIIITTTSPKEGVFSVNLKMDAGFSTIPGSLDIMDASEFAAWRNEIVYWTRGSDADLPFADPASLGRGTDWIDALSQTAPFQNYNLTISDGTKSTKMVVAAGYTNSTGTIIGSGFERYTGRIALENRVYKWLQLGVRANYAYRDTDNNNAAIGGTNSNAAILISPLLGITDTWNTYGDNGTYGGTIFNNPYISAMAISNNTQSYSLSFSPWARVTFRKYWNLTSKFAFTRTGADTFYYSPSYLPVAEANRTGGTASRSSTSKQYLLSETILSFKRTIQRRHVIDAMAGYTAERVDHDYSYMRGSGYLDDGVTFNNMGSLLDPRNLTVRTYNHQLTRMSLLGRANYSFNRRYYLTLTMRADGSSNFAANNKWGFFPAVALRWSAHNEKFLKRVKWINDLSFRASYGRSGNDAISSYQSLALLAAEKGSWLFGDKQLVGYYPSQIENSNLTWETTESYNIGFNFAVLRNRLTLEIDAYRSLTSDLLLAMKTAQTTGYDTYYNNVGKTRNTGIEVSLITRNVVNPKFGWTTTFTFAQNRQMTVDVGNGGELVPTLMNYRNTTQAIYGYRNGYPTNALWGYQYAGVWHNQEEIDRNEQTHAYVSGSATILGGAKYVDVNHDGKLDQEDYVYLGSSDPDLYGGVQNTFTFWGKLTLGVYFSYSLGGKIYNLAEFRMGSGSSSGNKYRYMLNSWHPERNPDSDIPRAYTDDGQASDRFVHDASYVRLQNLSINYTFDLSKKSKVINKILVGVSGENLWLWKRYNGFDPDVSTSPQVRRVDDGAYPKPRTIAVNLQFTY